MSLPSWFLQTLSRWRKASNGKLPFEARDTESSVIWLWTCSGKFFGYRLDDALFTYDGCHAGQFAEGDEIYDRYGGYIGEIRRVNRLVTNLSKRDWSRTPFSPHAGVRYRRSSDLESIQVMAGFEDFRYSTQIT
jgi:hypothetical protein